MNTTRNLTPYKTEKISFKYFNASIHIQTTTQRLYIRSYIEADFSHCLKLYSDENITKYFDQGTPKSYREIQEHVNDRGVRYFSRQEPYGLFSVFLKDTNEFIGQVDLVPTEIPGELEMGWIFHKQFHGKGYCSEAVLEFLIPLIKETRKLKFKTNNKIVNRVMATAHPENIPSNRMIIKAGLKLYKTGLRYGGQPRNWYAKEIEQL
jgi:RimJ/RimL family protein N-acetyltransferase